MYVRFPIEIDPSKFKTPYIRQHKAVQNLVFCISGFIPYSTKLNCTDNIILSDRFLFVKFCDGTALFYTVPLCTIFALKSLKIARKSGMLLYRGKEVLKELKGSRPECPSNIK